MARPRSTTGRKVTARGYVLVKVQLKPAGDTIPRDPVWAYEHRLILEQHLGRPLHTNEQVKWVNGDKTDNRIENLELWQLQRVYP